MGRKPMTVGRWLVFWKFVLSMWTAAASAGAPVAFVLCGGNGPPNEYPATVRWPDYVECAIAVGPQLKAAGITRVLLHNPGGDFALGWMPRPENMFDPAVEKAARSIGVDTRLMWVQQWLLAENSDCRFANREALKTGHTIWRHYGVTEVIYYVGAPDTLRNAAKEGPACVQMFLDCGEGASLGFDATAWNTSRWKPGDDLTKFYQWCRKKGAKVYLEPRLTKEQVDDGLGELIDGTVAHQAWDASPAFRPDMSIQPGESIRGPLPGFGTTPPPTGVTPLWADPRDLNWTKGK